MAFPTDDEMQARRRAGLIKLPVHRIIEKLVVRSPDGTTDSGITAVECSLENTDITYMPYLVYLVSSTGHGELNLLVLYESLEMGVTFKRTGYCDLHPQARDITNLYLPPSEVITFSFYGKLEQLLRHPFVYRSMADATKKKSF